MTLFLLCVALMIHLKPLCILLRYGAVRVGVWLCWLCGWKFYAQLSISHVPVLGPFDLYL